MCGSSPTGFGRHAGSGVTGLRISLQRENGGFSYRNPSPGPYLSAYSGSPRSICGGGAA
jgi:hypothetical protein